MTTNTTRRGILAGLPVIAVAGIPAAAAPPDAIFALIEEYKRAEAEHSELCEPYEKAECNPMSFSIVPFATVPAKRSDNNADVDSEDMRS